MAKERPPSGESDVEAEASAKERSLADGRVYTNVVFEARRNRDDKITGYHSQRHGRKQILLSPEAMQRGVVVEEGKPYLVGVRKDTKPDDPEKGQLLVDIIEGFELSDNEWGLLDGKVDDAEELIREGNRALALMRAETTEKGERLETPKRPRVYDWANRIHYENQEVAQEKLGGPFSPERALVTLRWENLTKAMRRDSELGELEEELIVEEREMLTDVTETPSTAEVNSLNDVRTDLDRVRRERQGIYQESPEAFYGLHLRDLKEDRRRMKEGKMVETPYVKEKKEDLMRHLETGQPVFIHGHLGSGKTQLAMEVASEFSEKGALIVSGSKHMPAAELYGHQVLDTAKVDPEELKTFVAEVEEKYESWVKEHEAGYKNMSPEGKRTQMMLAHERFLQVYLKSFGEGTISKHVLGPVYQAMQEGRPLIIDEGNAIPHELLISLNHILTMRPGDKVRIQQNAEEIEVQPGWGVILTGNLNSSTEQYVGRQDMDPAFLSRFYQMEYGYLPQEKSGSISDGAETGKNELLRVMFARLMDDRGNLTVPEGSTESLWELAKFARFSQDAFSNEDSGTTVTGGGGSSVQTSSLIHENVLSMRGIGRILDQWQGEGFRYKLDYYVWKEFVSQSTDPVERLVYYQQLQNLHADFFDPPAWETPPKGALGDGEVSAFMPKVPKELAARTVFHGPRNVVNMLYRGPRRLKWPETSPDMLESIADMRGTTLEAAMAEFVAGEDMQTEPVPEGNRQMPARAHEGGNHDRWGRMEAEDIAAVRIALEETNSELRRNMGVREDIGLGEFKERGLEDEMLRLHRTWREQKFWLGKELTGEQRWAANKDVQNALVTNPTSDSPNWNMRSEGDGTILTGPNGVEHKADYFQIDSDGNIWMVDFTSPNPEIRRVFDHLGRLVETNEDESESEGSNGLWESIGPTRDNMAILQETLSQFPSKSARTDIIIELERGQKRLEEIVEPLVDKVNEAIDKKLALYDSEPNGVIRRKHWRAVTALRSERGKLLLSIGRELPSDDRPRAIDEAAAVLAGGPSGDLFEIFHLARTKDDYIIRPNRDTGSNATTMVQADYFQIDEKGSIYARRQAGSDPAMVIDEQGRVVGELKG